MDRIKESEILKCSNCGHESEDIAKNPHAWDGWMFWLGGKRCADCVDKQEAILKESKAPA